MTRIKTRKRFLYLFAVCIVSFILIFQTNSIRDLRELWIGTSSSNVSTVSLSAPPLSRLPSGHILIGDLKAMNTGVGVGNQIFEVLSFIGIARTLKRIPVILYGPNSTHSQSAFPLLLNRFPKLLSGVSFHKDEHFYKGNVFPIAKLSQCCCCYVELSQWKAAPFTDMEVLVMEGNYLQHYKYLSSLSHSEIVNRLSFTMDSKQFAEEIVAPEAREAKNRICIHTRRGDFITYNHQYSTKTFILSALNEVKKGIDGSYSITLFGDDIHFLGKLKYLSEFAVWSENMYMTGSLLRRDSHVIWMYFRDYCDRILLTASTSTFGFWGAYLAGNTTKVYYNKPVSKSDHYEFPPHWIMLDLPNTQAVNA